MSSVIVAIYSLVGALVGAVVGHYLNELRNRRDDLAKLRLQAYADFVNAVSRLMVARRLGGTSSAVEELAALNDAKARICICANPLVVEALAEFWRSGGTLEREHEILAFTTLCMRLRENLGTAYNGLATVQISDTLFKLEPSFYSYRAAQSDDR